jgi:mRNA (guanine-N7-)-methyltransferase
LSIIINLISHKTIYYDEQLYIVMTETIRTTFKNSLSVAISGMIKTLKPREIVNELEFRLGNYVGGKFLAEQTLTQFKTIVEKLQKNKYTLSEETSLDIRLHKDVKDLENVRVTISGRENIRSYCVEEKLPLDNVSYQKKTKLTKVDMEEYGTRGQMSTETDLSHEKGLVEKMRNLINDAHIDKGYRYKHRYSFQTSDKLPIRFDLTLIKAGIGKKFNGILGLPEIYEVEIEYTNKITNETNVTDVVNSLSDVIYDMIKTSQNGFSVTTHNEKKILFEEYCELVFNLKNMSYETTRDSQKYFASMNVLPLELTMVTRDAADNYYIKNGFSVTDKADGDHMLLMISGNKKHNKYQGNMYFINNRMEIRSTGMKIDDEKMHGSIFDGELVTLKDKKTKRYLIFDCLFNMSSDMRNKPLTDRYQIVQKMSQSYVDKTIALDGKSNFELKSKKYLFHEQKDDQKDIFSLIDEVYNPSKYDYNLDGVILTPKEDMYPKAHVGQNIKWERLLKWKPIDQLSIDFMVKFNKQDGKLVIKSDMDIETKQEWKYVEASIKVVKTMRVGSQIKHDLVDFLPTNLDKKHSDFHLIRLRLDDDNNPRTVITHEQQNDIIFDNSVIEFIYDESKKDGYKWIPIRFRPDKTANKMPNGFKTADSTWDLIKNPVTRDIITGKQKISIGDIKLQYYTQNSKALGQLVGSLRAFHNAIKSLLISGVAKEIRKTSGSSISLMDVACGRAGDLHKWVDAKFNYVIGLDIDEKNLTGNDGAIERYKEKGKTLTKVEFIWADSGRNLNDGSAGMDFINKGLLMDLLSTRGPRSFDTISCQFAIHYFLGSEKSIDQFIRNVSSNLRDGGYFIATTLDGKKVYDSLKKSKSGIIRGENKNIPIWEIKRGYDEQDEFKNVGQKINVYNINIGQYITEYIVNFSYLDKVAKTHGLERADLNDISHSQSFQDLYKLVAKTSYERQISEINKMSDDEKTYSFMNNIIIYRKTGVTATKTEIKQILSVADNIGKDKEETKKEGSPKRKLKITKKTITLIDCLSKYKSELIELAGKQDKKYLKHVEDSFSRWYMNSKKDKTNILPKANIVVRKDLEYAFKKHHKRFNIDEFMELSANIYDKTYKKCSEIDEDIKSYKNKDNLLDKKQLARLEQLYNGPKTDYEYIKNKLVNLYEFVGINNIHLSIPPIFEGIELFGSPLNTHNPEFCSPFELEKQFGSLGSFFDYKFHKSGIYLCNPPFDEEIISDMANHLVSTYDSLDSKIHATTVITIPVWDSKTQIELGITDYGMKFEGYDTIMESKYVTHHSVLDKKKYAYYDYYEDKSTPASFTHLIILSNDPHYNKNKNENSDIYASEIKKEWVNWVRRNK